MVAVLLIIIFVAVCCFAGSSLNKRPDSASGTEKITMRCPTCGSPANMHGNRWECGWCGDFGSCSRK